MPWFLRLSWLALGLSGWTNRWCLGWSSVMSNFQIWTSVGFETLKNSFKWKNLIHMYIPGFDLQEKHYTAWVAEKFLALSIFMVITQKCTTCYILFPNDSSFPYDNQTIAERWILLFSKWLSRAQSEDLNGKLVTTQCEQPLKLITIYSEP